MKFYESGSKDLPVILLIPGTVCHWTMFRDVIPGLEAYFHVCAVSFDGFDETEETEYPDMTTETEKIETYVRDHFQSHVLCCYGSSLGGSYAAYLVQRRNIHIDHAILGSSDMDEAGRLKATIQARIVSGALYSIVKEGRIGPKVQKALDEARQRNADFDQNYDRIVSMFTNAPYKNVVTQKSIYNQFYSDLVTGIDNDIDVPGTQIHVFYALDMGDKYRYRYQRHFAHPDIREQEMGHEMFLICHPEDWIREVADCCGLSGRQHERSVAADKARAGVGAPVNIGKGQDAESLPDDVKGTAGWSGAKENRRRIEEREAAEYKARRQQEKAAAKAARSAGKTEGSLGSTKK